MFIAKPNASTAICPFVKTLLFIIIKAINEDYLLSSPINVKLQRCDGDSLWITLCTNTHWILALRPTLKVFIKAKIFMQIMRGVEQ